MINKMKKYVIYLITAVIVVATSGCADDFDKNKFKYEATPLPVTGIKLNKNELTLPWNNSETLSAAISPERAANKEYTWSSSNVSIAAVDFLGEVSAVGVGKATITVTTADGGKTDLCEVTVNPFVELDATSLSLLVGDTHTFTAAVRPATYPQTITWSSTAADVVSVTQDGEITALKDGSATIRATIEGDFRLSCTVSVGLVPAESVELSEESFVLDINKSVTLTATVLPSNAANQKVNWKVISNESHAIVSTVIEGNDIIVTRVGSGDFDIVAITDDGGFEATCNFPGTDPNSLFYGSGSKVWTWDKLEWSPLSREDEWWTGDFDDILGPYGSKDGTGATMTFSSEGLKLTKTKTDGSKEEGTFSVDLTKTKVRWTWEGKDNPNAPWSIGQLTTQDVTILWGVHLDHSLIYDDTKLPKAGNYPNGEADIAKVYTYDIISTADDEIVLAVPGDSPSNVEMYDWSGAWYWYFKEKK